MPKRAPRLVFASLVALPLVACGGGGPGGAAAAVKQGSGAALGVATADQLQQERLVGRFDVGTDGGPIAAWPNTAIEARFTGSALRAGFAETEVMLYSGNPTHPRWDVSIDGGAPTAVDTRGGLPATVTLASGLGAGPHFVRLTKITAANEGTAQFTGFAPVGGQMLAPPGPRSRRLEFIGDSGSSGYGARGSLDDTSCRTSTLNADADATYPAYVAQALDADYTNLAYAGKGITRNLAPSDTNTLPKMFGRILPNDNGAPWDFAQFTPDAVVLNAGGNDLDGPSCQGQFADPSAFVAAYVAFLQTLHGTYPHAALFAVLTTSGCDADRSTLDAAFQQAVARAQGQGLDVTYVPLPKYDSGWGFGCDYHPTPVGAAHLGDVVAAALQKRLGW